MENKLADIRKILLEKKLDAYIIPSSDPHQSEYVADHWKTRTWVSGFTGSAGVVVITQKHAGLWTDSRYFLQAETELKDSGFVLHKQLMQGAPEHIDWLKNELLPGAKVGCDAMVHTVTQVRQMTSLLAQNKIELVLTSDIFNEIWKDRPALPSSHVFALDVAYTGQSRAEKLSIINEKMKSKGMDYHLISTLDDICWVFNLRGADVECNPVFIAYAVIENSKATLFADLSKFSERLIEELHQDNILVRPYEDITLLLSDIKNDKGIWADADTTSIGLFNVIKTKKIELSSTPSIALKSIKNEVEIAHIEEAMIRDGVALTHFFMWLEKTLKRGKTNEVEVAEKLAHFRSEMGDYHGESFSAIVGYKQNGAIVHYHAEKDTCAEISDDGILLIDSGGQYTCGTTDITRTIALSTPTKEQKTNYTLVLKGHIAIARAVFPKGTKGVQIDAFARQFLWKKGLNYGHGTGHGVGFFLNVHEPPQGIIAGLGTRGITPLEVGTLTSNEPGFYKTGAYGIRIENLVLTVPSNQSSDDEFFEFKTMTLCPIDKTLIRTKLLTDDEKKWLNSYHKKVYKNVAPRLDKTEKKWLKEKCKKIN
ncbi:MAG: aminopeptidase P family protein [Saprospiraceae bacterium]|nr:aminopeptidase P family protein [Saprospiraceae bacterium]